MTYIIYSELFLVSQTVSWLRIKPSRSATSRNWFSPSATTLASSTFIISGKLEEKYIILDSKFPYPLKLSGGVVASDAGYGVARALDDNPSCFEDL
jgi:hypothetical protein